MAVNWLRGVSMKTVDAQKAGNALQELIKETATSHEPIQITSALANGILVSEEDWRAVQETLYLLAIPGMRESIREGMATPITECAKELSW
jgi:prevent-host-death family protein